MSRGGLLTVAAAVATAGAAAALSAVFVSLAWLPEVLAAVLVVALLSQAARRVSWLAPAGPLVAAAGVLVLLTARFTPGSAVLRVLPTRHSLVELGDVVRQGFTDVRELTSPAPVTPGLLLLAVIGVAVVALVVDLFAVTLRHPALAALPLLALVAVPSATAPHGIGLVPFLTASVGFLYLLLADHRSRVRGWGRTARSRAVDPVADTDRAGPDLGYGARRIGVAAVVAAVVVPLLLPVTATRAFGHGSGRGIFASGRAGQGPSVLLDLRARLASSTPVALLRYTTTDGQPDYLRELSLETFDGTTWTARRPGGRSIPDPLPAVAGLAPDVARTSVRTTVTVENLADGFLPAPYPATAVAVRAAGWRYDATDRLVWSSGASRPGQTYTATSAHPSPTTGQLDAGGSDGLSADERARFLAVPASVGPQLRDTAASIAGTDATPYRKAVLIQQWLRGFSYDTTVAEGGGIDGIEQFLRERRGFCVQFASTMALFARLTGIPARVVVGFTPGTRQADGSYLVTSHDAHAWPELWFSGIGWLRFEPTPLAATGSAAPPSYSTGASGQIPTGGAGDAATGGSSPSERRNGLAADQLAGAGAASAGAPLDSGTSAGWARLAAGAGAGAAVVIAAVAVTPTLVAAWARRRRWRRATTPATRAETAWTDVRHAARDAALPWSAAWSPRHAAAQVGAAARLGPEPLERLVALALAVERQRYAPVAGPPDGRDAPVRWARATAQQVRRDLSRQAGRRQRVRAALLPAATVDVARDLAVRSDAVAARVGRARRAAVARPSVLRDRRRRGPRRRGPRGAEEPAGG